MKKEFTGFYLSSDEDFEKLWSQAIFVLDTNVLLNLYRYQKVTTEELLKVFDKLKERIWVPYHVALEYQRNRLKVIASQNNKFSEVKGIVEKGYSSIKNDLDALNLRKRHSTIEPELFLSDIKKVVDKFIGELESLENAHFSVLNEDKVRLRLDSLLEGSVGPKPSSQKEIDELQNKAEARFSSKIPPGYMDDNKGDSSDPIFTYSGISYSRKYSDYLVWHQILEHARDKSIKNLVFITDDNKEDWWLKIKQNGDKTISPRPELVSEIMLESQVENFHMYSSEKFLKYANEFLGTRVSTDVIEDVRDVAVSGNKDFDIISKLRERHVYSEKAVYEWLASRYGKNVINYSPKSQVPMLLLKDDEIVGFVVRVINSSLLVSSILKNTYDLCLELLSNSNFDNVVPVFVCLNDKIVGKCYQEFSNKNRSPRLDKAIFGLLSQDIEDNGAPKFIPHIYAEGEFD